LSDPISAACADNNMTVNHHSGGGSQNDGDHFPASLTVYMVEDRWAQGAVWQLLFGGVFERHPNLKFVTTESGTACVVETLDKLDSFYRRMIAQPIDYSEIPEAAYKGPGMAPHTQLEGALPGPE